MSDPIFTKIFQFCRTHHLKWGSSHVMEGEELRGFQFHFKRGEVIVALATAKQFDEAVNRAISNYEVENVII